MSMRKAINDKCRACIYDPEGQGNWRQQVSACTVTVCALYPYRPVSKPDKRQKRAAQAFLGDFQAPDIPNHGQPAESG
jgi:hypothetical protein